jgi:S-(hydroxymethyl)glutathione dehydrogenase/alcohol dehydrogenase
VQAAVLSSVAGRLEIVEVSVDNLRPREVLVRTSAVGLCHSDLHCIEGVLEVPLPIIPGHEASGVVEEVGQGVGDLVVGDHVVACLSMACGSCRFCKVGRPNLCADRPGRRQGDTPAISLLGSGVAQFAGIGALAEYMVLPEQALVAVDPAIPLDRIALLGCAVTTGLGAVFRTAAVPPGATVAVVGCGGIGLNVIQGARIAGAALIIAIDVGAQKLEMARRFGATDLVDASAEDAVGAVQSITKGGVEFSFEAIGQKGTMEQAFRMLRDGGLATLLGLTSPDVTIELPAALFVRERRIQGCLMGTNRFQLDIPFYLDLYRQGRLELDALVSSRRAIEDVNNGFDDLRTQNGARTIIEWGDLG